MEQAEPRGADGVVAKLFHWLIFLLLAAPAQAWAGSVNLTPLTPTGQHIESAGTAVAIAMPLAAAGISYFKHDTMGLAQLTVETALTVGTAYALKEIVREERPDGSDFHSFPSGQTALAAS